MALRAFLITMIVAKAVAPALADVYTVGGILGWNIGVNFTSWAEKNDFRVGDSLMFMYLPVLHNVIEVDASEFQTCTYSKEAAMILTSGNDTVPLESAGQKWYISGVLVDCALGMKLGITVSAADGSSPPQMPMPGSSTPPPPPSTSAAGEVTSLKSCGWLVALMAVCMIIA